MTPGQNKAMIFKHDIKQCVCIKDGFMKTGRQFCIKDKKYFYIKADTPVNLRHRKNFRVRSEGKKYYSHSMGESFFLKHFQPIEFLTEEEMTI